MRSSARARRSTKGTSLACRQTGDAGARMQRGAAEDRMHPSSCGTEAERSGCARAIALAELASDERWTALDELVKRTERREPAPRVALDPMTRVRAWLASTQARAELEFHRKRQ
jgi:hypothetical protein